MFNVNKYFKELISKGATVLFVEEEHNDLELTEFRKNTCEKNVGSCYNENTGTCKICKCLIEAKAPAKKHRAIKKMRVEVTHCPLGKWKDKKIANHYREIDNKPLIK